MPEMTIDVPVAALDQVVAKLDRLTDIVTDMRIQNAQEIALLGSGVTNLSISVKAFEERFIRALDQVERRIDKMDDRVDEIEAHKISVVDYDREKKIHKAWLAAVFTVTGLLIPTLGILLRVWHK